MTERKAIIAKLNQIIEEKIRQFEELIADLRSSNTETKSSMGDKYETSREMLQQEIMNIQRQLAVFREHQIQVRKLTETVTETIKFGSVVKTSAGDFVIVASLGAFELDREKFVSISAQTPLAQQLIGKKAGDSFSIQQKIDQILEVG